ncbi:hypothetical protein LZK76_02910 [Rhizobium leguminosarum]|nr:hypothetical protein LZK76_02910 [Rhizobium leguminosarum]
MARLPDAGGLPLHQSLPVGWQEFFNPRLTRRALRGGLIATAGDRASWQRPPPPIPASALGDRHDRAEPRSRHAKGNVEDLGKPRVVTLSIIITKTPISSPLESWLNDPKNRRQIPKYMDQVGYARLANSTAEDGFWVIGGKRTVVYGRKDVTPRERFEAVKEL